MNWLTNFVKPRLGALVSRREVPNNLWKNCPSCGTVIHHKDLKESLDVCNNCNYHFRMSVQRRIETLFNKKNFFEINFISLNLWGFGKPFNPACVSPILSSKKNRLNTKQIILPIKNLEIW